MFNASAVVTDTGNRKIDDIMSVVINNAARPDSATSDEVRAVFMVSSDKIQSVSLKLAIQPANFSRYIHTKGERVFHVKKGEDLNGATLEIQLNNLAAHDFQKVSVILQDLEGTRFNVSTSFLGKG